jgi:hypothetical protein
MCTVGKRLMALVGVQGPHPWQRAHRDWLRHQRQLYLHERQLLLGHLTDVTRILTGDLTFVKALCCIFLRGDGGMGMPCTVALH